MNEEDREKRGISSFTIRIIAYIFLAISVASIMFTGTGIEWTKYLTWFCYPLFAFLLAEGFEQTSGKFRYFVRLLLFAIIAEVPYNLLYGGSWLYKDAQNGMFTLCLGFLAMCIIDFVYRKTYNVILSMAAIYVYGWGAYFIAKYTNCQFNSFGIMLILMFYIANQVTYPKLVEIAFMIALCFYIASEAYISFIIGYMQYTIPYRALAIPAVLLTWFYKGKRGPNSIPIKIGMYAFYPILLTAAYFLIK